MSSIKKSVANEKKIHGITVKRLAIGAYLSAIEKLGELPEDILRIAFPELSSAEAFAQLKGLRTDTLLKIIGRGAAVVPERVIGLFADLLDIQPSEICDRLTPSEFMDVVAEFLKINDISNFTDKLKGVVRTLR